MLLASVMFWYHAAFKELTDIEADLRLVRRYMSGVFVLLRTCS
jgi:hypothetical protein